MTLKPPRRPRELNMLLRSVGIADVFWYGRNSRGLAAMSVN